MAVKIYAESRKNLIKVSDKNSSGLQIRHSNHRPLFVYVGRTHSGKSLLMQQQLKEFCDKSEFADLPFITLIHYGQAAEGFAESLGTGVSSISLVVRNTKDSAINIFDTQVGLPKPLPSEKRQIKAFLMRLLTPMEQKNATDGTTSLVNDLINEVFEAVIGKDATMPKFYIEGINDSVDAMVSKYELLGMGYKNTFFELASRLHFASTNYDYDSIEQAELLLARDLAHSLAMPVMSDLLMVLNEDKIIHRYSDNINSEGEPLIDFARRTIKDAMLEYPSLSGHTTLNRRDARIVSIDLSLVLKQGDIRQNSLFLQAARAFALKPIYIIPNDLLEGGAGGAYEDYYDKKLARLNSCGKMIAIDGLGFVENDSAMAGLLEFDVREFRKLGISLAVSSDSLTDFDPEKSGLGLLGFARNLFVFSAFEEDDWAVFERYFTNESDVLLDLTAVNESTYFSYEIFSAVAMDSIVKTALKSKQFS